MKQNTTTPSLPPLRVEEFKDHNSLECSPRCVIPQETSRSLKVSPPQLSPETRRVCSGSIGSSASSSVSTYSSSSSASSLGFGTYDDPDDIAPETNTNDEGDPIISFEALSLETRRIAVSIAPTSPMALSAEDERTLGRMKPNRLQNCQLSLEALFKESDGASNRSTQEMLPTLSMIAQRERQQQETCNTDELAATKAAPRDGSILPEVGQRRSIVSKRYTIRKIVATGPSNFSSLHPPHNSSRALRPKRQRGGSDFSMPIEGNSSSSISPRDRRKRRRMNRNRAMAADEFDSILSQINTTGSL